MFQEAFERMTEDTTATAPSTMKIKVVVHRLETALLMVPNASIAQKCCRQRCSQSAVSVQGTATLRKCKSVPICFVATLMSLATAGRGPLSVCLSTSCQNSSVNEGEIAPLIKQFMQVLRLKGPLERGDYRH